MGEILGRDIQAKLSSLTYSETPQLFQGQKDKMKEELQSTHNAQLAVFLVSYGKWLSIFNTKDFKMPDFMLGHSLGECTALCASGAMSFKDALRFVFYRGRLMDADTTLRNGSMVAVTGDINTKIIEKCIKRTNVEIANYNSPRQVVISGERKDLDLAQLGLRREGYETRQLPVSGAFHHSQYMKTVKVGLSNFLEIFDIKIRKPAVPIIFNFTGTPEDDPKRIKSFMVEQPVNTLRWRESIERLMKEGVPKELIQEINVGRSSILTNLLDDFPDVPLS